MYNNDRIKVSSTDIARSVQMRAQDYPLEKVSQLYSNLAVPSYVHGYSLAFEYMRKWFESKFDKGFFKGGIYIDGKHVLDDYKDLNKNLIKGVNPRGRIAATVQYDYDRENIDLYGAPPQVYLRRSEYQQAFLKDYDLGIFLGVTMKMMRMDFNFKVRVNTRAQQQDVYHQMMLNFRIGVTHRDQISVDFHVPKKIILSIATKAGFEVKNNEVVDILSFLSYLNKHSEIPFLFKMRAINQKPEFFIRINDLFTHIDTRDQLQLDDGERNGKLDFNFHIEMNAVLSMPIPQFYAFYCSEDIMTNCKYNEMQDSSVAIYSINILDIPKVDEHNWNLAATTQYQIDKGDTYIDMSTMFQGENSLSKAINHVMTKGVSPSMFMDIKLLKESDVIHVIPFTMNWEEMKCIFKDAMDEDQMINIAIYYDREYINTLDIVLNEYNKSRVESIK